MKDTPEDVRNAFELWLCETMGYPPQDMIFQDARNCYADYSMHLAYSAWKAGKADLLERLARPVSDDEVQIACDAYAAESEVQTGGEYEYFPDGMRKALESYRRSLLGDKEAGPSAFCIHGRLWSDRCYDDECARDAQLSDDSDNTDGYVCLKCGYIPTTAEVSAKHCQLCNAAIRDAQS